VGFVWHKRGHFPPAKFYLNNIGSDTGDLVGELETLNIQEDGPVENGHAVPEVELSFCFLTLCQLICCCMFRWIDLPLGTLYRGV
jgi:hypothetical protein